MKKVKIVMHQAFLESFIKDLLSSDSTEWKYKSFFSEVIIELDKVNKPLLRKKLHKWLSEREIKS